MPEQQVRPIQGPKRSSDYLTNPEMYHLVRSKENALEEYLDTRAQYGEEHAKTRIKFALYFLKAQLITLKETISDMREIIGDFAAISEELDSLFEIDFGETVQKIVRGVEKYPKFLQRFIVRRRAKKYYGQKIAVLKNKLLGVQIAIEHVTGFTGDIMQSMMGISSCFSSMFEPPKKKGKKGGGSALSPEIEAEIRMAEEARNSRRGATEQTSAGSEEPKPSAPTSGTATLNF